MEQINPINKVTLKDKMKSLASSIAELEGKIPDTFKEDGRD